MGWRKKVIEFCLLTYPVAWPIVLPDLKSFLVATLVPFTIKSSVNSNDLTSFLICAPCISFLLLPKQFFFHDTGATD
jgi:hypothetical protein